MMKKLPALLAMAWAALLGARPALYAFGVGDRGTTTAQFLKIGPGARPSGMGQAFAGVADDIHSLYYNPAGLGNLKQVEVTGMHNSYLQGMNYEFGAITVPVLAWGESKKEKNAYGVVGFAVYSLAVSGIDRRGVIETDEASDTFGANDYAYALSYAYAVPDLNLSVGATAKFIDLNLDSYHARGFAADIGGLYRMKRLSIGLGMRNGGNVQKYFSANDPLPLTIFAGLGYRFTERLIGSVDLNLPRDNNLKAAFGGEYRHPFTEKLSGAARAGYNTRNSDAAGFNGATFGLGVGYYNFDFDFAWVPFGDLGSSFNYSLRAKF